MRTGGVRARSAAATAVLVLVVAILAPASVRARPTVGTDPAYDGYGGWTGRNLDATGHFRTAKVDGRWWLIDPDGHPFFSNGINHVTPEGTVDRNGRAAYHEAILAKYGSEDAWADGQLERFDRWGTNTLGDWSDAGAFAGKGVPYTVMLGWAGGGNLRDLWDPAWAAGVQADATALAATYADDPWLVGYFLDNEVAWTDDWRKGPFVQFFGRGAGEPGKAHLVDWLGDRYANDFAAFAADFETTATGWDDLADATEAAPVGPGARATKDAWTAEVAERFFSVTGDALRGADPDHLNLGSRLVGQLITPGVLDAAAANVDVISINWYEIKDEFKPFIASLSDDFLPTDDTLAAHRARADKPFMITEFGWRAMDSGLPNTYPPLQVVVETQQDRADSYRNFGSCLANTGDVVGAHWFEMTDEPAIGRFDGEDDNWGMVTEADDEYDLVVEAAAEVHDLAYAPLTDADWSPGPCTPISDRVVDPEPTTTTTTTEPTTTTAAPAGPTGPPAPAAQPVGGSPTYAG